MTVRLSQLASGLRVVSQEMPHLETVSLGVWIKAGSRNETEANNGIAHFLEHMAFKGTTSRSAYQIVEEIESVGGDLNAATGLDQTSYYALVLKPSLSVAMALLGDILNNPVFSKEEIAREAQVIEQEILASFDAPDDVVFDLSQSLAFPDQAVGRPVMGTREKVLSFRADDLTRFMEQYYHPSQMVIAAAGAVDHAELLALAEEHFAGIHPPHVCSDAVNDQLALPPACYVGGVGWDEQAFEQSHIVAGFEGIGFLSKDIFTAQILNYCLGGGMSSRLFQEVREKRGLAYQVYGFHSTFEDTGFFGASAATDALKAIEVIELMFDEFNQIADKGLRLDELNKAKAQLKSGLVMALESSASRAEQLARQILFFNKPLPMAELIAEVDAVGLDDCQILAQKLINRGKKTVAVAGGQGKLGSLAQFESAYTTPSADVKRA